MMSGEVAEAIIDPDLPIIDPHHHLWFVAPSAHAALSPTENPFHHVRKRTPRYLLDELLNDLNSGHNIQATVFVECYSMYRAGGPPLMKPVGEVEFVAGVAAMSESGAFGKTKICAGIIGGADLTAGDAVQDVLHDEIRAAGGRYRGVRFHTSYDTDPAFRNVIAKRPQLLLDVDFRRGFRHLEKLDLAFDALLYEPQLPELVDLAYAFPNTRIVLNHTGSPLGFGRYAGKREERFAAWCDSMKALSKCENVFVKLGGLGMPLCGFDSFLSAPPATSEQLAKQWKPYIHTCIEVFGANRCMFESNFPTESGSCTYAVLWNTFKRLAENASQDERLALFGGVATKVYRLVV